MNVIIVAQMPTPYRVSLWDEIGKDINLKVICITEKEKNRFWDVDKREYISILNSFHFFFEKLDWGLHFTLPFNIILKLIKNNPDIVVVAGYDAVQFWEAILYTKIFRKKIIMWNGSTLLSSRSSSKIVFLIKKLFISLMDGFYTYGSKATEYIESFQTTSSPIYTGTNTVDIKSFLHLKNTFSNSKITQILYVGQLIERKGISETIQSLSLIKNKDWELSIIGSGSQELKLKRLAKKLNLDKQINFLGYKQKNEILTYFERSDIFLMPSLIEVWGLVLNEALASGLFCLSSKYAGASFDLIENNINGYIIDPKNINEYSIFLEKSLASKYNKEYLKAKAFFSIEKEANKWVSFFKQLH